MKKQNLIWVLLGILFISFNLRAPLTAVGSVVEMIQKDSGLSNAAAGLITTLPLIAFAVVSPFVSRLFTRIGHGNTMFLGLCLILAGELCRSYTGMRGLFIGTVIIGCGIAIGNVLIPSIIKLHFSGRVGLVTSLYTSGMCIFAALGAGISMPLAKGMSFGWKHTLAIWFFLTLLTILIWLPQTKRTKGSASLTDAELTACNTSVWKDPLAWWVTLFMGTQSLIFYSLVAWLPTILLSKGMTEAFAGNMAFLFQIMAIPATLLIPILCDRVKDQRVLVFATCIVYATGMGLFLIGSHPFLMFCAILCMSVGMGGSISLSIAFISLRSPNSRKAAELSGMSQSAGYLFAALGPIVTGFLYDTLAVWSAPLLLFLILIGFLAFCGLYAGKSLTVADCTN